MIPISPFETRPRPYLREPGWPLEISDLDPFNRDVETLFGVNSAGYEQEPGLNGGSSRYPADDPGLQFRWAKTAVFGRRSLRKKWVELAQRPNVHVLTNATATSLHINPDSSRVQWVDAADLGGRRARVVAGHFVLAAGTIETTRLMLWTRECMGQPSFGGPALGHYFQDHPRIEFGRIARFDNPVSDSLLNYIVEGRTLRSVHFELTSAAQEADRVYGAFAYVQMNLEGQPLLSLKEAGGHLQRGRVDLRNLGQLVRHSVPIAKSLYGLARRGHFISSPGASFRLLACVEQQPTFSNCIKLADKPDPLGVPKVKIRWKLNEQDGRAFRSITREVDNFWSRCRFEEVAKLELRQFLRRGPGDIIAHAKDAAHPSGSTRMGVSGRQSVVSPLLTCHDAPNLSIVSASVFPTAGSANPTFTVMRLAMWHAEHLARNCLSQRSLQL